MGGSSRTRHPTRDSGEASCHDAQRFAGATSAMGRRHRRQPRRDSQEGEVEGTAGRLGDRTKIFADESSRFAKSPCNSCMKSPCNSCRGVFPPYRPGLVFTFDFLGFRFRTRAARRYLICLLRAHRGSRQVGELARFPQHPATLDACQLRSETERHGGSVLSDIRKLV